MPDSETRTLRDLLCGNGGAYAVGVRIFGGCLSGGNGGLSWPPSYRFSRRSSYLSFTNWPGADYFLQGRFHLF